MSTTTKYIGLVSGGVILAFVGLTNALYLVQSYISGNELACSVLGGCNAVAASPYSIFFDIPLSSWGALFYVGMFVLGAVMLLFRLKLLTQLYLIGASIGFLLSVYLTFLQFFVIKAVCIYCMFSALVATLLLVVAFLITRVAIPTMPMHMIPKMLPQRAMVTQPTEKRKKKKRKRNK